MSDAAIAMMLVSMAVIWGGLVVSVISLLRHGRSDRTEHQPRDL